MLNNTQLNTTTITTFNLTNNNLFHTKLIVSVKLTVRLVFFNSKVSPGSYNNRNGPRAFIMEGCGTGTFKKLLRYLIAGPALHVPVVVMVLSVIKPVLCALLSSIRS